MDAELLKKGDFKVAVIDGNLILTLDTKGVDVNLKVETDYFLDQLKAAIPGELDDKVIDMLKIAFKAFK